MTIASLDDFIAAKKQHITYFKNGTRTTVAVGTFTGIDLAGQPGAGVLGGTSTNPGVVPTDADAGFPNIVNFDVGASGYLIGVQGWTSAAARWTLFDMLWKGGAYAFGTPVTGITGTDYSGRIPNGDYSGTEIWFEAVTGFTGNLTLQIGYRDQDNNDVTTTVAFGFAPTLGRMYRIPLASGDYGVKQINSVTPSGSSAGTFNVLVMRRLAAIRAGSGGMQYEGIGELGMPQIFDTSALIWVPTTDSTSFPVFDGSMIIASK